MQGANPNVIGGALIYGPDAADAFDDTRTAADAAVRCCDSPTLRLSRATSGNDMVHACKSACSQSAACSFSGRVPHTMRSIENNGGLTGALAMLSGNDDWTQCGRRESFLAKIGARIARP